MITDAIAAVGIARIAPMTPHTAPPSSSATITATGLDADAALHDFRHEDVGLELVQDEEIHADDDG